MLASRFISQNDTMPRFERVLDKIKKNIKKSIGD
jgi:hypothetical protein